MSCQQKGNKVEVYFQLDLFFLEYLKKAMIPHQKQFNIVDLFEMILQYCIKQSNQNLQSSVITYLHQNQSHSQQISQTQSINISSSQGYYENFQNPKKRDSIEIELYIQQRKLQEAQKIIDKLKQVFLWYKKQTISFQMINNYVLSCQNQILKDKNSLDTLSQYQNLPHRRIRLDQNVKLCIMPQGDSSKIKFLSINPSDYDNEDVFRKQIFIVTSEYIRSIKIDSQKLAQQGNKTVKVQQMQNEHKNKISLVKNWYTYSEEKIIPQSMDINAKDMKINSKKQLYIEKVAMSQNIVGIITHERDIFIRPLLKQHEKHQRGRSVIPYQLRLGNMISDIPDQNLQRPLKKDKVKALQIQKSKILLFECYNDDVWIAVNQLFVYVYILPLPDSNQHVNDEQQRSSMLSLCEPLPAKGQQALLLTKEYMAVMMQDCCVMILKLQLSSKKQERHKNKIYPTNKVYNDIKFICMDYHPVEKQLVFTDFGSYLIRLKFNITNGDIQRQGPVYNQKTGKYLTENTTNTRRDKQFGAFKLQSQIHLQESINMLNSDPNSHINKFQYHKDINSSKTNKETLTIWQNKGRSINHLNSTQIHINNFKEGKKPQNKDKSGKSIHAKPQNTDYIKIVKNSSRQNMILLCLNKNNSTLITYEQTSVNPLKNGKSDFNQEADVDRLYDKTIKLWDLHYMNVYQTFTLSLQISHLSLQSNGLYIVTKERGYLGFYPLLNKEQQQKQNNNKNLLTNQKVLQKTKFGSKIVISGSQLYFYTQLPKQRNNDKVQESGYQNHLLNYNNSVTTIYNLSFSKQQKTIQNLQQIPAQITQMDVQNKIYVLSDTNGDKRYNLNVYDILGNKELIMKANKRTQKYGIMENYTDIAKINHFQFNLLLWNKRSLKLIGSNVEQSFTIHWTFSCNQKGNSIQGSQSDMRSMKSSSKRQKTIEEICINQNSLTVLQKHQNDLFRNITLTIFSLQSARIKYRVHDIKTSFKVLSNFNSMLLVQESFYKSKICQQNQFLTQRKSFARSVKSSNMNDYQTTYPTEENQECINLFDFNSPFNRKCIFTMKYKSLTEKTMSLNEIKQYETGFNNLVFQDRFFIQNIINIKSARIFTLNKDDSIVISCIFHIKTQYVFKGSESSTSLNKLKILKSQDKYFLYSRQISSEVAQKLNYIPRTIDKNIKKRSKKVENEYVGQSDVHDRILGHWQIDLNELITRSTIKNFSYQNDFHAFMDQDFSPIIDDITEKLIKFSENQNKYQSLFQDTSKIIKIFDNSSNFQRKNNQEINISWILAEAESFKSVLCLNSQSFFQIYTQSVFFDPKSQEKLKVLLQKICQVDIDPINNVPIVRQCNESFSKENKKIWQETKLEMIEYMKKKMSKQFSKKLSTLKSSMKKEQQNEVQSYIVDEKVFLTAQSSPLRKKAVSESKCYKNQFNSNQINNIFRQWTISKNIEKQLKSYQKNNTEAQQVLNRQLKVVIENPQKKEERIQYLLEFPQKIKDITTPVKIKLLTKNNQSTDEIIDVKSILNSDDNNKIINQQKKQQQPPKVIKPKRQIKNFDNRLQNSLQKLQKQIFVQKSLPKTVSKTIKSSVITKLSQLKLTERKMQKTKVNSSLSNQTNYLQHSGTMYANLLQSKSCFESPILKTKTQRNDKNYIQLITQTPLQSIKSNNNNPTHQKFNKKIHSPNPQSSLSNIIINRSQSKHQNITKNDFSKLSLKKSQISQFDCIPAKKNKSLITRCKTQVSNDDQTLTNLSKSALMQLKQSAKTINQTVLPQIKINREKLNEKMKQKKSFLKSINQRLGTFREQIKSQILKKQLNQSLIKLAHIK